MIFSVDVPVFGVLYLSNRVDLELDPFDKMKYTHSSTFLVYEVLINDERI